MDMSLARAAKEVYDSGFAIDARVEDSIDNSKLSSKQEHREAKKQHTKNRIVHLTAF